MRTSTSLRCGFGVSTMVSQRGASNLTSDCRRISVILLLLQDVFCFSLRILANSRAIATKPCSFDRAHGIPLPEKVSLDHDLVRAIPFSRTHAASTVQKMMAGGPCPGGELCKPYWLPSGPTVRMIEKRTDHTSCLYKSARVHCQEPGRSAARCDPKEFFIGQLPRRRIFVPSGGSRRGSSLCKFRVSRHGRKSVP